MDFETGVDKIDPRHWTVIENFASLKRHASVHGNDLWVTDGKDTLIIKDFSKSDLEPGDFLF